MDDNVWIDDTGPRLLAALPCEDGVVSVGLNDGRITLQRVFHDVYASVFPAAFDRMNIVTIWMSGEENRDYEIGVRLSGPDGTILAEASVIYTARPEPAARTQLFHFSNDGGVLLDLPTPGRYTVDVLLEGVPIHTFPLFVVGPPEEAKEESSDDTE